MLEPMKDKAERRLSKVKIGLMRNPKFALWSGIMMMGKTEVSDTVPTAYTNGRDEVYGREFINELNDKELGFVVLHENLHKAFRHLTIWRKLYDEDAQLANMACDYVINLMIVDSDPTEQFVAVPRRGGEVLGCLDEKYRGLNAKQVFDMLKQEEEGGETCEEGETTEMTGGTSGGGSGKSRKQGFDEHGWDDAENLSEQEKEELVREVDRALRQGLIAQQRAHGKGAGAMERELIELLTPKVDWREVLREFVKSTCSARDTSSWRKVNRRYLSSNTYMPSLIGESIGRIVVGVDTSGSISGVELSRFLTEVQSIAREVNPSALDLIYWDAAVASHEEYTAFDTDNIVSSTKPKGGGGTDPTCVMRYMKEKNIQPECVVMLTDGYVDSWGSEWQAPVLWVVTHNKSVFAPVGQTIHIED